MDWKINFDLKFTFETCSILNSMIENEHQQLTEFS